MLLITSLEKGKDTWKMNDPAAMQDLLEATERALEVLGELMNSALYMHDADFRDFEELYEVGAGEEVAESLYFLLCDPSYDVRRQSELEDRSHDLFEPSDMEDFCDLAKTLTELGIYGHVFFRISDWLVMAKGCSR